MKKYLFYSIFGLAAFAIIGASMTSAHGFGFGRGADLTSEEMVAHREAMIAEKAEILGVSVEVLEAAKEEGKRFHEIAEEQGLDMEELHAQMMENKKDRMTERLQDMVSEGTITQEQADERQERMQERFENGKGRFGGGCGGHRGPPKGFHKGNFGQGE